MNCQVEAQSKDAQKLVHLNETGDLVTMQILGSGGPPWRWRFPKPQKSF